MIRYYSPADVREADRRASELYGIPTVILMENAARSAAEEALKLTGYGSGNITILAGKGNNGGDGFAAARLLAERGRRCVVLKTGGDSDYLGDAGKNLAILRSLGSEKITIYTTNDVADHEIRTIFDTSECILEGLLGTGTKGAPRGEAARIIRLLKKKDKILALDIPSGMDPEDGRLYEPHVEADITVTFLARKSGMAFAPADRACGEIITAGIGAESCKLLPGQPEAILYTKDDIRALLPEIPDDIHKTRRGNLLVYAGSADYRGAPLLTARGALRSGAGIVFLAVPDIIAPFVSASLPEAVVIALPTEGNLTSPEKAYPLLEAALKKCGAAAVGPGTGLSAENDKIFRWLWNNCPVPFVADADILTLLSRASGALSKCKSAVITPHEGEAARLLGISPAEVAEDRPSAVKKLTEFAGAALLKGRKTLIASAEGPVSIIGTGSPALAVPGSGDVLTGAAGAMLAAGLSPEAAARAAALVHGAAGDRLERKYGRRGCLAGEIADEIPFVLRESY